MFANDFIDLTWNVGYYFSDSELPLKFSTDFHV